MRTKKRIHPYVSPNVARRLSNYSAAKGINESAVVQAAVEDYLDGDEKDNALIIRRLNRLTRATERHTRDLDVLSEAFAVFVRIWIVHRPPLAPAELDAAKRQAGKLFDDFIEIVSQQLVRGPRLAKKVIKEDDSAGDTDNDSAGPAGNSAPR